MRIKLVHAVLGVFFVFTGGHAQAGGVKFEDNFDSGSLGPAVNGYKWTDTTGGEDGAEKPVVSTDIAHSGNYSLKYTFIAGPSKDDAFSEQRMQFGENLTDLYVQFFIYYLDGTEGLGAKYEHRQVSPNNNKFFRAWDDNYRNYKVKLGFSTRAFSPPTSGFISEFGVNKRGVSKGNTTVSKDEGIAAPQLGRWLQIDMHVTIDSGSGAVMQLWIDGTQLLNNSISNYPDKGIGNYFRNAYFLGWANSGFNETTSVYIDDVVVSDTPIVGVGDALVAPPKPPLISAP